MLLVLGVYAYFGPPVEPSDFILDVDEDLKFYGLAVGLALGVLA